MAVVNRISEQEFRELVLSEPDHLWELWDGVPREKPPMSMKHTDVSTYLGAMLISQLDRRVYRVTVNGDRVRLSSRGSYIPDVVVIPTALKAPFEDDPGAIGAYGEPLPLVVEVWSPPAGRYDLATKLNGYKERSDLEIWFIHPYEKTLVAWRRQPDGSYSESRYESGIVPVASLPGVSIDLDILLGA